jgi:hypothetical protein
LQYIEITLDTSVRFSLSPQKKVKVPVIAHIPNIACRNKVLLLEDDGGSFKWPFFLVFIEALNEVSVI